MSTTTSVVSWLRYVDIVMAALRRVLLLGQAYVPTHPIMVAILIPPPQVGHVVVINKDTCAKEFGAGKTPPCQTKACAGTTPVAGSWCFHARQVCCSSSKKINQYSSFCAYYGFKQPRFVATFEEEMMMMQEEGMITANEYSIDCRTCGSGKCA
jgi:hypothetical protein